MKLLTFFLIGTSLIGCNETSKKDYPFLKGTWISNKSNISSYPSLSFSDSTAIFTSIGDTVYRFKYHLDESKDQIILTDAFNKKINNNILKNNNDSLVFDSLWDLKTVQRFHKK